MDDAFARDIAAILEENALPDLPEALIVTETAVDIERWCLRE
jgi:hypothetical protein